MHNALKFILNDDEEDCEEDYNFLVAKSKASQVTEKHTPSTSDKTLGDPKPNTNRTPAKSPRVTRPNTSKEIVRPKKIEPESKFNFKPTINPNSQKILERLNAFKQQKESHIGKIEDSLLQRQRQQLVKSKSPTRPSERQMPTQKNTSIGESNKPDVKAFASQAQIENFYSKRFFIRGRFPSTQGEQARRPRSPHLQGLQLPTVHQQVECGEPSLRFESLVAQTARRGFIRKGQEVIVPGVKKAESQ
jgi:hypothetical protein